MRRCPLLLALLLPLLGAAPSPDPLAGKLVVTGSSTIAPLAAEIAKRFESEHPAVRVDVQSGGSSRGVADARNALSDLGMVSRALKADEADLKAFTIAMDGVCVILHKDNPIASLTDAQIVAIYTGKTTNWRAVGGPDRAITVVNKAEGRSTLELFVAYFKLKTTDVKAHVVIGDNAQGIKTVTANPGAIGYVSIGSAEYEAQHGAEIKLLPVGGVAASTANVKNGTFPISRPLNLVVKGTPKPLAEAFLKFAQSGKVNDLVVAQYFVTTAQ